MLRTTAITNQHHVRSTTTRNSLQRIALEMFAEHGFDDVRIADIAAAAGVSERTFYRHFPTKEAVLFQDYQTRLRWLAAALEMRPRDEKVMDSVRVAVRSFPDDLEIVHQAALLRSSLIDGDRAAEQLRIVQSWFADVLCEFIRVRVSGHEETDLLSIVGGNVLAAALVAAVDAWGQGKCEGEIDVMVDRALELVRTGFGPLA
jgi:AcrR family transcriptional regulator